jgi:hypothetical protein
MHHMYEPRGKSKGWRRTVPVKPEPDYGDLHLRGNTIKRLRFFSTMDNKSYDDILNLLMDVIDGRRRRTVFERKAWLRDYRCFCL